MSGTDVTADEHTGRAIEIGWVDSGLAIHPGWRSMEATLSEAGVQGVFAVRTVGIWMGENDDAVFLAHSHDEIGGNWNGVMVIWKPAIRTRSWL